MTNIITEQHLQEHVEQLSPEMTPERDLWSGIERAIQSKSLNNEERSAKKLPVVAWAASVVAAVLVTWISLSPSQQHLQSPMNLVANMQQDFEQQKQSMLVNFGTPDLTMLPAAMQAELTKLGSAQITIKQALDADPNNSDLLNLLRWTQKQELDLLKQLYSPQWQTI
jgi:anti-sigma-K factor RskA